MQSNRDRRDSFTFGSRWGQAAAYIPSPPSVLISGGKTDSSAAYTYTSALNSGDVVVLPLTDSFPLASAPFALVDIAGPSYAWHTLAPLQQTDGNWSVLSFGGDGGSSEAMQTVSDSTWLMTASSNMSAIQATQQAEGWGSQPMRRIHHSIASPSAGGQVFITGGEKDDGSGSVFSEAYCFDGTTSTFSALPSLPQGLFHHVSALLQNGTLVVLGGVYTSSETSNPTTLPLTTVYTMDTSINPMGWTTTTLGGIAPSGRRGAGAALVDDGSKLLIFGGASSDLSTAYDDIWTLDLGTLGWTEEQGSGTAPSGRYDHSVLGIGSQQVLVLGGYGIAGPSDAGPFIYDAAASNWLSAFTGSSSGTGSAAAITSGSSGTTSPGATASTSAGVSPTSSGQSVSMTAPNQTPSSTSAVSMPSGGSSLSTSAKIAIGVGSIAAFIAAIGLLLLCCRRRRNKVKRQHEFTRDFFFGAPTSASTRPYGAREKGGTGLLDEEKSWPSPDEQAQPVGLGMGVVGSRITQISSLLGRQVPRNAYAEIRDQPVDPAADGLLRQPTRRVGTGIRLVGPRDPRSDLGAPVQAGGPSKARSSLAAMFEARRDMLGDEDKPASWQVPSSPSQWKSAASLLSSDSEATEDPFEDVSPPRPIRGGPVPTPQGSIVHLVNSFGDDPHAARTERPASNTWQLPDFDSQSLDLALLSPPQEYSDNSLPSNRSRYSALVSDVEEGSVHQASLASRTPVTVLTPPENAFAPVRRTESFFRRMAAGGITSLLPGPRPMTRRGTLDIRDPAPAPSLWPVLSHDSPLTQGTLSSPSESHPPSSFKGLADGAGVDALNRPHGKGPSLSSLNSARSMRDMVIVQREPTDSSEGAEAIIESTPSPALSEAETDHATLQGQSAPTVQSDNGNPQSSRPNERLVPESDKTPTTRVDRIAVSPIGRLPGGRRPVRDVVNSINKRAGGALPSGLFSPMSTYSTPPSPSGKLGASQKRSESRGGAKTTYEAVKRSPLMVANPDKRKASGSEGSA